jgi:hypothetical protein
MAFLVLLSAAARARIISSHLRLVPAHRLHDRIVAADAGRLPAGLGAEGIRLRLLCSGAGECRRRLGGGIVQNQ